MTYKKIKKIQKNPHPVGTKAHAAFIKRRKEEINTLQANLNNMATPEGREAAKNKKA
tara:strand:- start:5288 stop:5458 length:171 start_codon:yes stop_codon:yes gene_type:complete